MKNFIKGFTLIELLIVIALLGALAVGLLAALDPFEQLKKGNDTGIRNTAAEIQGAIIRYYAIKSEMPWNTVSSNSVGTLPWNDAQSSYSIAGIASVIAAGELKSDFSALAGAQLKDIRIGGTDQSITACFKPGSKSFRSDNNTKFNSVGVEVGTGPANCAAVDSNSFSCYWCIR